MKLLLLLPLILTGCLMLPPEPSNNDVAMEQPLPPHNPDPDVTEGHGTTPSDSEILNLPPETTVAEKPNRKGKVVCEGPQNAHDGGGGFLAKDGDTTHKVVVLLPGKFAKADKVVMVTSQGKAESLAYHGLGNPDSGGDRTHWRGSRSLKTYKGVVTATTGTSVCEWKFKVTPRVD